MNKQQLQLAGRLLDKGVDILLSLCDIYNNPEIDTREIPDVIIYESLQGCISKITIVIDEINNSLEELKNEKQ